MDIKILLDILQLVRQLRRTEKTQTKQIIAAYMFSSPSTANILWLTKQIHSRWDWGINYITTLMWGDNSVTKSLSLENTWLTCAGSCASYMYALGKIMCTDIHKIIKTKRWWAQRHCMTVIQMSLEECKHTLSNSKHTDIVRMCKDIPRLSAQRQWDYVHRHCKIMCMNRDTEIL